VSDSSIGSVVAGHRIERFVGRGGMGVVYAAVDLALDRTVALKLIAPELAAEPGFRRRFMTESKIAASIDHPNVVPIFRAGEEDGRLFLAMRFVSGDDLRTLVERDGPLAPDRAGAVIGQVAAALAAAHARGLVHRDVKPANVLVTGDDHCYLTDFGLVKDLAATAGATQSATVMGTLDYVAPERIQGGETGPWTDVYALGCVLFFALTSTVVFPLEAPESKLWAHVSEPPPAVSTVRSGIPEALDAVVARALAKDPRERYASASELAAAVAQAGGARLHAPIDRLARAVAALPPSHEGERIEAAVVRARQLHDAVAALPPEEIEREIAAVRSGHGPNKAERVDALAQRLAAQRRRRAELEALNVPLERLAAGLESGDADALGGALDALEAAP
jgi:serine/threonine protein kinase